MKSYVLAKNLIIVCLFGLLVLVGCASRQKISETSTVAQSHQTNYDSVAQIFRGYLRSELQANATSSEVKKEQGTRIIAEVTVEFNDSTGAPKKQTTRNISEQYGAQTDRQTTVTVQENYFANFVDSIFRVQRQEIKDLKNEVSTLKEKQGLTKFQSYLLVSGVIINVLILLLVIFYVVKIVVLKK